MALLDLIIIGAGPAGMTAAIYAKRKGLSFQVISDSVGGQVTKTGTVENYPGYERIPGPQLAAVIKKQLEDLKIEIRLSRVSGLVLDGVFKVSTADGAVQESRAVIIASGSHWRELSVPGEKEYRNRGVSYCTTCDAPLFSGMDVAVVGGGNSAAEAVLDLMNFCPKIYMVVRSTLRADKVAVDKINASGHVTILTDSTVEQVRGKDFVESIDVVSAGGERKTLAVGGVFVEIGLSPNVAFVKDLVKLNERGEIVIDDFCRTSVPGLFACGDVTDVPQKQIIVAAGEGAKAAIAAFGYISTLK
jgi:alkyl hydroperoxide reductase subunit F